MEELKSIQWYPGHMTRTKRKIESQLKLIDAVAIILDARVPYSSCNPDLRSIINNKPRMVVGIPNVGKSSFINRMAKQNRAKVEDRPGVTRGNQWFTIGKGFDLLDTPGVLWHRFDDKQVGEKLAYIGSIKDEILDTEHLAGRLLEYLRDNNTEQLCARYKLIPEDISGLEGYDILELVGKKRGMLISGGEINTERAALTVLDEFRSATLGKITLDKTEDCTDVKI